jgi:alanyl-tRNA synthetase
VLGTVNDDRPSILALVSRDLVDRGIKAGDLIRDLAPIIDGRGGGRPDLAEAGGKNAGAIDKALESVGALVSKAAQG